MAEGSPCRDRLGARDVLARERVLLRHLRPRDLEEARHVVQHREEHRDEDRDLGAAVRYDVLGPATRWTFRGLHSAPPF